MVAGQEVNRIATIACSNTTHAVLIGPRLTSHIINCTEVIADILSTVVARNLIEPLLTERRQTATVRSHNNIPLSCHQLIVPTVAPTLANHTLRTAPDNKAIPDKIWSNRSQEARSPKSTSPCCRWSLPSAHEPHPS